MPTKYMLSQGRTASLSLGVLLALVCQFGVSQTVVTSGVVRGIVSDQSGAAVPQASVVLVGRGTSLRVTRTTNGVGIFVFPSRTVGTYDLEVSAAGFRKEVVQGVDVQIGQTATVDIRLQPGAEGE